MTSLACSSLLASRFIRFGAWVVVEVVGFGVVVDVVVVVVVVVVEDVVVDGGVVDVVVVVVGIGLGLGLNDATSNASILCVAFSVRNSCV